MKLTTPAPIITMPSAIGSQTTMSLSTGMEAYLFLVLLPSGLAALRRLAKRRHRADLAEDVECVELVPVLDEAPVLDPPDVDRAHGKGIPGRGIAKETPCVRAHIAVATHHARAVRRAEDILGEHLEVGHARNDCAKDLLGPLRAGLGEGVVVHIAGREDLIEARYVVARHYLGEEMAKLDMIGRHLGLLFAGETHR